jgi:hypothetical protein
MPTAIRLTTMLGKIQKGRHCDALVLDLFGPSLGQEDISIREPTDVAPAVRAFGERIRAASRRLSQDQRHRAEGPA